MAKLKIKPKDFEKRRNQSKTFKDWNDENGKSSSYVGTHKRKATVLDDEEVHYRSAVLNRNTRIDGSEDLGAAIAKISDGNMRAGITLLTIASKTDSFQMVSCLLSLDSLGYYGSKICELFEDSNENPDEFLERVSMILHGE